MSRPDFTSLTVRARLLVTVADATGAVGWRFAVGPTGVHVGSGPLKGAYEGKVITGATQMRTTLGDGPLPEAIVPSFTLTLSRTDADRATVDALIAWLRERAGARLRAYLVGPPWDAADEGDLEFAGTLGSDAVRFTAEAIELRPDNALSRYDQDVPTQTYAEAFGGDLSLYRLPTFSSDDVLPILYGDWATGSRDRYLIRAGVVREAAGADLRILVAQPNANGLALIGDRARWRDAAGNDRTEMASFVVTDKSLASGLATLDETGPYTTGTAVREGDVIAVREARGNCNVAGELIENPALILLDLLSSYGGVPTEHLDTESFYAAAAARPSLRFRRHITEPGRLLGDYAAELCRDAGLVLTAVGDRLTLAVSRFHLWADELAAQATLSLNGVRVADTQELSPRPREFDYGRIRLRYDYDPAAENYRRVAVVGTGSPTLEIASAWIWRPADAAFLLGSLAVALLYTTPCRLTANVPAQLDVAVNGAVTYAGEGGSGVFYVYQVDKNYDAAGANITAIAVGPELFAGKWMAAGSPNYDDSTELERQQNGYWIADASATNARYSRWKT